MWDSLLQRSILSATWREALSKEFDQPYFKQLLEFVAAERSRHEVYPPDEAVFAAFESTPLEKVAVLILGQDPYHDVGQAHGLSFSVPPGVPVPPSLRNILRELRDDLKCPIPNHGCLQSWANQGVLMLNAVLTVRAHEPASHQGKGWEQFTDAVIHVVNARRDPVVFVLWGGLAQRKIKLIDDRRHAIITSAHPSPLSAKKFFGTRPFSKVNDALRKRGRSEIDWCLPGPIQCTDAGRSS